MKIANSFLRTRKISRQKLYKSGLILGLFATTCILVNRWLYVSNLDRLRALEKLHKRAVKMMILSLSNETNLDDRWKCPDVSEARIFSAFLDSRPEVVLEEMPDATKDGSWALIRIIAILRSDMDLSNLTCYYKGKGTSSTSKFWKKRAISSSIIAVKENFEMRYAAAFVLCDFVTDSSRSLPTEVTISLSEFRIPEELAAIEFVKVRYSTRNNIKNQSRFMAVCVPVMHHQYDKYMELIEFVEFYRMMGVERFTFYRQSTSREVELVLELYKNIGLAIVLEWELPSHYVFERTLRYGGIFATLNDCLYRSTMVGGFKYVVNVDFDEFIIPRKHTNFTAMMNYLDPLTSTSQVSSFIVRNVFFYTMYDDDPVTQKPGKPKLTLQSKTTRWKKFNPPYDRSKYIVRGQEVIEMGNHRPWLTRKTSNFLPKRYTEIVVEPEIAASHHYRKCETNVEVCWLRSTIVDTTAHKFTRELEGRVAIIRKELVHF